MNTNYVTVTATDIIARYAVSRATASGFIRFLVDSGIGQTITSVARTGRGRAPTTVSVPETVLTTLTSFIDTRTPTRVTVTPTPTTTDDSLPF